MAHLKRSLYAIPAVGLSFVLALGGCPVPAIAATSAELQTQLEAATKQLNTLGAAAEQAGNDLATVTSELEDTKAQIEQTQSDIEEEQKQLEVNQSELGVLVSDQYKTGGASVVTLLLSSGSFSSLISNVHYADKAAEHQQNMITETRALKESLEQKKTDLEEQQKKQEELVSEQQKKSDAANAAVAEAQSYYDQLSTEVKQKIAEEEEAARKKAEEEARAQAAAIQQQAQQSGNNGGSSGGDSGSTGNGGSSSGNSSSGNSGSGGSSSGSGSSTSSGSSSGGSSSGGGASVAPSGSASAMVQRAYSVIGSGYSYTGYKWTGSTSTSWFTCSGLVDYAMGYGPWSNSPATFRSKVRYLTYDVNSLSYGDLVFFKSGSRISHVGIYIGSGRMIDSIPGGGVGIRSITYIAGSDYRDFAGGGPIY